MTLGFKRIKTGSQKKFSLKKVSGQQLETTQDKFQGPEGYQENQTDGPGSRSQKKIKKDNGEE
ncbi:hypothetical protein PPACK8108_LOCUS15537 [Phakopsora pachyrhizi]|uniref:Uncharacterized protein n=1 Tax=Phakopsora pachyrhizi TaxID=170000 RepID=A0AAV0B909_PHAPC|nr:hypothetical protein PPACK8108_LOCUS15537 [Phakopsora pachyrhizi]